MQRLLILAFTLIVLASGLHLGNMGVMRMPALPHFDASAAGSDCPMGYVCPMRLNATAYTAAQPMFSGFFGAFAVFFAGIVCLAFNGVQTGYAPPFIVAYNSGPPIIRTIVKRE